jgi:hypothetical protein
VPITDPPSVRAESAAAVGIDESRTRRSGTEAKTPAPPVRSRLWIWFVVAFAVQLAVWIGLFVIAAHHPVEEVPLATPSAR